MAKYYKPGERPESIVTDEEWREMARRCGIFYNEEGQLIALVLPAPNSKKAPRERKGREA